MPTCTRNGCKKEFSAEESTDSSCTYHPGVPVFHEGLKSWSCCQDVNKPELDFDQFMKIEGCCTGAHTTEAQTAVKPKPAASSAPPVTATPAEPSVNTPSSKVQAGPSAPATAATETFILPPKPRATTPAPPPVEEEDDVDVPVAAGTRCKRKGCGTDFVSDEEHRLGDGEGTVCTYHPGSPIFHEGSKGYMCCKRRVLEFDEFLKIEGCKKGRHLFVPKKTEEVKEVLTTCRIDHYQTPQSVTIDVFAKKTDKDSSKVEFRETEVVLDLFLPDKKRFSRTLTLYGPIIPTECTYRVLGTKVELVLKKKDNRVWNVLEATDQDLGFNLTFGVGGRTGTIGSRAAVLDDENKLRT